MKKFLEGFTFVLVVTLAANCSANSYDDSPYYVFVTTVQGTIYLDLRTVNVHDYNPPYYQIAGYFVWVNGDKERRYEVVINYNWDKKETYHRGDGYWIKDRIEPENVYSRSNRKMADALFRAAYGMDFYGY
ncbi:MAG: hypothetical protein IJ685_08415 [Selenomonadaceae bacterium]|nr:hypothetical protein [Selenomonadaceae bacterium]